MRGREAQDTRLVGGGCVAAPPSGRWRGRLQVVRRVPGRRRSTAGAAVKRPREAACARARRQAGSLPTADAARTLLLATKAAMRGLSRRLHRIPRCGAWRGVFLRASSLIMRRGWHGAALTGALVTGPGREVRPASARCMTNDAPCGVPTHINHHTHLRWDRRVRRGRRRGPLHDGGRPCGEAMRMNERRRRRDCARCSSTTTMDAKRPYVAWARSRSLCVLAKGEG